MSRPKKKAVCLSLKPIKSGSDKRKALVDLSGGQCAFCFYQGVWALQYHHFGKKRFTLDARTLDRIKDEELILQEWERCILVCSNCHLKYHYGKRVDDIEYAVSVHLQKLKDGGYYATPEQ